MAYNPRIDVNAILMTIVHSVSGVQRLNVFGILSSCDTQ